MDDVKGLCERLEALHRAFVTGIASRDAREGRLTESRAREWAEECVELFRGDLEPVATALTSLSRELAEARAERDEARKQAQALQLDAVSELMRANDAEAASAAKDERIRELEAEVARVQSDREYVIGFNAGWDEAAEQALRFPTMLRKMWAGGEVQQWIDRQMDELRARSTKEPT